MKLGSVFPEVALIGIQDGEESLDHPSSGLSSSRRLSKPSMKAWDSSVDTVHPGVEEVRKLSCRLWQDLEI